MWLLIAGVYLGWALGANDAANVFGTGVTSGLVNYRTAIILTSGFVLLGALMEGHKPMGTVGHLTNLSLSTAFLATLSAALVVSLLTYLKLPVSTSQAILGAITGMAVLKGGFKNLPLDKLIPIGISWILTPVGGMVISFVIFFSLRRLINRIKALPFFTSSMKMGILGVGCYGAYALGSNNVANTTGAFVGTGFISLFQGALIGGLAISMGVLTYSRGVMTSIGKKICPLGIFSALVVILAQAITVHLYTQIGIPVSTSQAVVGAVAGIGLVKGIRTVNKRMLFYIFAGWVITPLLAATLSFVLGKTLS